jgi:hypothetical protein
VDRRVARRDDLAADVVEAVDRLVDGALVALGSPRTAYGVAGAGVLVLVLAAVALRPRLDDESTARTRPSDLPVVAER